MNLAQMLRNFAAAADSTPDATGYLILLVKMNGYEVVWRRLRFPAQFSLRELHLTMQAVTLFGNYHLYQFVGRNRNIYSGKAPGGVNFGGFGFDRGSSHSAAKTPAGSVLRKKGDKLRYEYDFGDCWTFTINVEKLAPIPDGETPHVTCLGGEKAGPVEDCGGIPGYMNLLKVLDKSDPDDQDMELLNWLGDGYDPDRFDMEKANRALARIKAPRPAKPRKKAARTEAGGET